MRTIRLALALVAVLGSAVVACASGEESPAPGPGGDAPSGGAGGATSAPDPDPEGTLPCDFVTPGPDARFALASGLVSQADHAVAATDTAVFVHGSSAARTLLRSKDDGATWTTLTIPVEGIFAVAGASGRLFLTGGSGASRGVFTSENDGDTWQDVSGQLANAPYTPLQTLRSNAGHAAIAGTVWDEDLQSFAPVALPLDQWDPLGAIVATDGQTTLVFGFNFGVSLFGRSENGGPFEPIDGVDPATFPRDLAIEGDLAVGVTIDGALMRSNDAGTTWDTNVLSATFGIARQAFLRDGAVYLETSKGIVRSLDGAYTFELMKDIPSSGPEPVMTSERFAARGNMIFFGSERIFRAEGQTGAFDDGRPVADATPFAFARGPEALLVSTADGRTRATTDGSSFVEFDAGGDVIRDFTEDAAHRYVLTQSAPFESTAFYPDGRIATFGSSGHLVTLPRPPQHQLATFHAIQSHDGQLFAASHEAIIRTVLPDGTLGEGPDVLLGSYGVWRTSDGGATWLDATGDLPVIGANAQDGNRPMYPSASDFASLKGDLFMAVDGSAVFRTSNDGVSWDMLSEGLVGQIDRLVVLHDSLYAFATKGSALFRLDGDTWTPLAGNGLPNPSGFASMAPAGNLLFASVADPLPGASSTFVSEDGGSNWTSLHLEPKTIALFVDGTRVYAGTREAGLYVLDLGRCITPE